MRLDHDKLMGLVSLFIAFFAWYGIFYIYNLTVNEQYQTNLFHCVILSILLLIGLFFNVHGAFLLFTRGEIKKGRNIKTTKTNKLGSVRL